MNEAATLPAPQRKPMTPGILLKFPDQELEDEYLTIFHSGCLQRDLRVTQFNLILTIVIFAKLQIQGGILGFIFAVASVACGLSVLYLLKQHPAFYIQHRTAIIMTNRITRLLVHLPTLLRYEDILLTMDSQIAKSTSVLLQSMAFKASVMAFFTIGYILQFRHTLPLTSIMMLLHYISNVRRCSVECSHATLAAQHLDVVASLANWGGSLFTVAPGWHATVTLSPQAACWLSNSFVQTMLGFCLPLLILTAEEEHTRLEFLAIEEANTPLVPSLLSIVFHSVGIFLISAPIVFQILLTFAIFCLMN